MERILITGATGFIGQALLRAWAQTAEVAVLTRARAGVAQHLSLSEAQVFETPAAAAAFAPEVVVHLAGAGIADRRWTAARRALLHRSRIDTTRALVDALRDAPPRQFLAASAIGYYGFHNPRVADEQAAPGVGFAAELCAAWEAESRRLASVSTQVSCLRLGLVLGPGGGLLARLLTPFRLGLGGRIGSGDQGMSWIHQEDVVGLFSWLRDQSSAPAAVNATAPNPVSNQDFTRALGQALRRPTPFPLPATLVNGLFGVMGKELLLGGAYVHPAAALAGGYEFRFPSLPAAFADLL
jgi:uncharacterized protein (TIGR01777 family)